MNFLDVLSNLRAGNGSARSHMKNLIEMAAVDGNFDNMEYDLLKSIAKRNGISEGQLKDIRSSPASIKFEIPKDGTTKFMQLYDLVHMMSIDKNVHDEELKLCNLFAVKFGYKRELVPELIESVRTNILNGQGVKETMKRVGMLIN